MEYWIMRDGTSILIKDMSTEHIMNAMTMLSRRFYSSSYRFGTNIREVCPSYKDLDEELDRRRGIKPATDLAKRQVWNKPNISQLA